GVFEDDDRVLPAELEVDVLQVVGGVAHHGDSRLARARQRDDRHVGMPNDSISDIGAEPMYDVYDAGRDSGLPQQLDEALAEERRVRRGLEDHSVAADKG